MSEPAAVPVILAFLLFAAFVIWVAMREPVGGGYAVDEECSCGATFSATGVTASTAASSWRVSHPCTNRRATWEVTTPAPTPTPSHDDIEEDDRG